MKLLLTPSPFGPRHATSLIEVVMSIAIAAVAIVGSVTGYVSSAYRAEWSAYSLAANSLALQRMEQTRAAKWDTQAYPMVDRLISANFGVTNSILDVPLTKTNIVYATNYTTITTLSANPPLKMVRVDCVWAYLNHGRFTNTVICYRAPDQ